MSQVTVNGHTYSDAGESANDMRNGGHRTHLLPMIGDAVVDLAAKVSAATTQAALATSNGAAQVALAESAAQTAINAPGTSATSATSATIALGSTTITIQTGKNLVVGMFVQMAYTITPTIFMNGVVTSYNSGTGSLSIDVSATNGSGTYTDWTVSLSTYAQPGTLPAGTSTTSATIARGSTTITTQPGLAFSVGQEVAIAYTPTPTIKMTGTVTAYNPSTGSLTVNITNVNGNGTYTDWTVSLSTPAAYGLQTLWVPAGAMVPRSTSGAAPGNVETITNKLMIKTLDFDTAAAEYAQFSVRMPKAWDKSPVTASFLWSHAATVTNFGVEFAIQAVAISDDDALDVAFGAAQVIADTGGTTNDLYVSGNTPAITIGGIPTDGDLVFFQAYRNVSSGSDTMAIDARLHGITIFYTLNGVSDA